MPPLIQVVDHDATPAYRSRQRSRSRESHEVRQFHGARQPRKIREKSRILLLQDLAEGIDQSFGANELLDYARELKILKDPMLGHYFVNLPWVVKSSPVSELAIPEDLHSRHSGDFDWIGKEVRATPKYLWDSHEGCTVRSTKAMLQEGYIAVSWTWGRYQRQSQGHFLERRSRGVGAYGRRWRVPQLPTGPNGKDVLSDLKACLKSIESCRYFWVDLLCIDQHKSFEKRQEIAKQASIFGSAKATICYLWHQKKPEDFSEALLGLGRLLNWALVFGDSKCLSRNDGPSIEQEFPTSSARHLKDAFHARFGHLKDDHWFTSLWALQEIVLAPAGVWMTRYGHLCKVNGQLLTTRLMAIIIRLLSWAAHAREELWNETRSQSSLSPRDWEQLQKLQAAQDNELRQSLEKAFDDLSHTWQCTALRPTPTWLNAPSWLTLRPRSAPPLFRRGEAVTAGDGFQGIVIQTEGETQGGGHWLFERYRKEQGLREEIRKWTAWSFGHACIDVALPTTRTAIIVAGAKRSIMESHDQSREIALLAALKVQPPEWFREGHEAPPEVLAQRSKQHLSPILLNTILKNECVQGQGARLFDVTHNLPRRTADTSVDMNDFDETEWDQTEFEVDYILEEEIQEAKNNSYQALSSMQTDRPVRRIQYEFHGNQRYAEILPGGVSNLTDMLPDTASMLNQHILHFASESSIQWRPSDGWHMHKHGVLHLPHGTEIQQIRRTRHHGLRREFDIHIRPNGGSETDYEVRSYKDLKMICRTQPWLQDALGHKSKPGLQQPQFRFLPLGEYPRHRSSRSPSPQLHTEVHGLEQHEVVGVVLVAKAVPQQGHLAADVRQLRRSPQGSPRLDPSVPTQASDSPRNVWHKFGSYRATGLETLLSQEPNGFFVVSYTERNAVEDWTKSECEQLLDHVLHVPSVQPASK